MEERKWKQDGRKERDREISENGGSVARLMCGRWVDRVAELWLWNGSWQSHFSRGDLPGLSPKVGGQEWITPSTCHEYLFGESVHRLLCRMTNRGQLPLFFSHLLSYSIHLGRSSYLKVCLLWVVEKAGVCSKNARWDGIMKTETAVHTLMCQGAEQSLPCFSFKWNAVWNSTGTKNHLTGNQ